MLDVLDLSDDKRAQDVYKIVLRHWWPHSFHGMPAIMFTDENVVLQCVCGAKRELCHAHAHHIGLIQALQ